MAKDMMTQREVADYLDVCEKTVYNLIHSGKLKAVKIGTKSVRISRESLAEYLGRKDGKTKEAHGGKRLSPALREEELTLAGNHIEHWLSDMTVKTRGSFWGVTTEDVSSKCEWLDKLETDFFDVTTRLRRKICME